MADCAFTLTREEQIAYIEIESRRGKGAPEILNALEEVVPTSVLAYSTIRRWVRELNNGRSDVSKKHLCGRPVSATDVENVEKVAKQLNDDRRYCYEIKCITGVLLKFIPQVIVGKYGASSVSSKLMNW